jgi:6-phosphogluconolactonase
MKLSKLSRLVMVAAIGLIVAACLTACTIDTIDYIFVACSAGSTAGSAGQIETYAADAESGALRQVNSVTASGGTNPIAMAVTSDDANLYVANQGNNTVVHFAIAGNGALTQKDVVTLTATPVYLAVNNANTFLYVVSGATSATLTEYALSSGTIGSATATVSLIVPGYTSDTMVPTSVNVLASNGAVYASAYDKSAYNPGGTTTSNANPGWLFGYSVGSSGALTPVANSPYQSGVKPSAIASDPTSRFVFVTDFASNELIGYDVQNGGVLDFQVSGPYKTGNEPASIQIDPRGIYIYLANSLDNSVSGFTISLPTGTPSTIVNATASTNNGTDTDPVSVMIDPSLGRYVYTANHLGNSISGFRLNAGTGALTATQSTPYPTGANPSFIIGVPHGNHAIQVTTP